MWRQEEIGHLHITCGWVWNTIWLSLHKWSIWDLLQRYKKSVFPLKFICFPWRLGNRCALKFNSSSRKFLPPREPTNSKGSVCRLISEHFSNQAVNLWPGELLQETCKERIPFHKCLDIKTVDIIPFQREATDYFLKKKDVLVPKYLFG